MSNIRSYYKSSSFKSALLFTIILGVCAAILGYLLYDFSKQNFVRETEAAIDSEIEHILSINDNYDQQKIINYIKSRSSKQGYPVYFFQDKNKQILAGNIKFLPEDVEIIKEGVLSFYTDVKTGEGRVAAKIKTFSDGSMLLVGRDIHKIVQSSDRLKIFTIVIMAFIVIVIVLSFLLSIFVVSRINKVAIAANTIMKTGDLSCRLNVDSSWDDLSYLAQTLNDLFDKIESLMSGIRDASDNIAHDLRTPITRLKNNLEDLKGKKTTEKSIEKLIDETDHILNIFSSLLRISNIEKGKRYVSFAKVDVMCVLEDVIELYEPFADDKNLSFSKNIKSGLYIQGDRDLLFQMFANLIDNAIKFSPCGEEVNIIAGKNEENILVEVSDAGIGVPKEDLDRIFDRFFRTDKSRNTKGNGLGLSMVKAVVDLHKASIKATNNDKGLTIRVKFLEISNKD